MSTLLPNPTHNNSLTIKQQNNSITINKSLFYTGIVTLTTLITICGMFIIII